MIGSPEYELAKFLDSLIRPYIPDTYMLRSSQELVETLKNFQFKPNHKLVSFDVKSLFSNANRWKKQLILVPTQFMQMIPTYCQYRSAKKFSRS